MRTAQIYLGKKLIADKVKIADSMVSRMIGLMFKKKLDEGEGLLLESEQFVQSIHTFFMRFNIDVIFMSKKNEVIKVVQNMKPWRMTKMYFGVSKVLELRSSGEKSLIKEGDCLEVKCIN